VIKNSIIIYDHQDTRLGKYFEDSAKYAITLLNTKEDVSKTIIDSEGCNSVILDEIELPKHTQKTLFVICSHGLENRFLKDAKVPFIEGTINCDICLDDGLVYSIACSTGKTFGKNIVEKNASFYGYDNDTEILPMYPKISLELDNYGLFKILEGSSLQEAKELTKDRFNHFIDQLDMINASKLRHARDSLVVHGKLEKSFF